MRADRLMRLLVLLQRHRRVPAPRLAKWLEVSERTILRDMEALSAAGVPVYTERGRGGGCVLLDGFTTDASGLTAGEAQALFAWAGHESAAELGLGQELSGALAKIAASASPTIVSDAETVGAVLMTDRRRWFADAEKVAALPVLREAAQAGRRVRLSYASPGAGVPSTRTVDPHGLVDQSGRWYLLASHRGQLRSYRVSRIHEATVLPDPVRVDHGLPLDELWREVRSRFEAKAPDPVMIEVSVSASASREFLTIAATSLVSGTSGEPLGDGRWRLQVRAPRSALALVLAWAPDVVLHSPAHLLADIRRTGAALAELYG